jgi:hypothetical protein
MFLPRLPSLRFFCPVRSCGPNHLRVVWRLSLGLGVIPAAAVFAWRYTMEEPELYKKSSMKAIKIPYMLVLRKYGVRLAAISFTWYVCFLSPTRFPRSRPDRFVYDFIVYVSPAIIRGTIDQTRPIY